jgi:hypothetical protein
MIEQIQRSLYRLSAGDLGTSTSTLEEGSRQTMNRCAHFDCALLFDDADGFLKARSPNSLQRYEHVPSKWIYRQSDRATCEVRAKPVLSMRLKSTCRNGCVQQESQIPSCRAIRCSSYRTGCRRAQSPEVQKLVGICVHFFL